VRNSASSRALRGTLLRSSLWLLLGGWVGSWLFFAMVIARTAFQVLPSTELAGRVVAPALTALHVYGALAGVAVAGLARGLRRSRLLLWLPLVLAALCAYSQLSITAEMEALRPRVWGPGGDELAAARYRLLHGRSMLVFSAVCLGAVSLVFMHARADASDAIQGELRQKS